MKPGSSACAFPGPGCSCRVLSGGILHRGPIDVCGLGSQRLILTGTLPCALHSALRGDFCPAVRSAPGASWDLTLTLTLPGTGTLQGNLSLPRTLTLHLSRLVAWALTSALEGDHETSVASALATSLSRTLTLAKAVSPWGPNSYVRQHLGPGVQKRCGLTRHGTWKLTAGVFPGPAAAALEDSGGHLDQGPVDVCGLGSQRLILTGTLPCALHSETNLCHFPHSSPLGFANMSNLMKQDVR